MFFVLRGYSALGLVSLALGLTPAPSWAQRPTTAAAESSERSHAVELYEAGNFVEAAPLLEKLSTNAPTDQYLKESYAVSLYQNSMTLSTTAQRKIMREKAHAIAVQAKELGDNSQRLQIVLNQSVEGSLPTYSNDSSLNDVIRAAEVDYARGDMEKAREGYQKAVQLDPKNYDAPLYAGDTYFRQKHYDEAGVWYDRAVKINPNRETAYRYWADAFIHDGKKNEARTKFIEAIIAEPYNRAPRVALSSWLEQSGLALNMIQLHDGVTVNVKDGAPKGLAVHSKSDKHDPNSLGWMSYGMLRLGWNAGKFKQTFPNEVAYRQTLQEETECLEGMLYELKEAMSKDKDLAANAARLDPSIQSLRKIHDAGLLEPYVLLNRPNKDIIQDYAAYRSAHREKLLRYLDEIVVPKVQ